MSSLIYAQISKSNSHFCRSFGPAQSGHSGNAKQHPSPAKTRAWENNGIPSSCFSLYTDLDSAWE
jgi:hypothetical protein